MTLGHTVARPPDASENARLTRILVLLIVSLIPIRLFVGAFLGLTSDEAIVVVKAHHPQLSYFDHPPLASLLVAAMQWLAGSDSAPIMRLPATALFAGTTWLVFRIGSVLFNPLAGFCGAVALSLSPLFSFYFGGLALTDAPMLFGVAAATLCLCHALFAAEHGTTLWWLGAGLFTGLALLSKSFSAGVVVLGVLSFLLSTPRHRHWLARPAPYLAASVTLVVMTPIFVWNARNEWITLSFPGGHPLTVAWGLEPVRVLTYLGLQALIMLPWIWFGLVAALVRGLARGPHSDRTWFLSLLAVTPISLFLLVRLFSDRKGIHWAAPGYLLLFPLLGVMIETAIKSHWMLIRRLLCATVVTLALIMTVCLTYILTGWGQRLVPQFQTSDPFTADLADWDDLRDAVARRWSDAPANLFFIGTRWEDCAKIEIAIRKAAPVLCLTPTPDSFAYFVNPQQFLGRDGIIVTRTNGENNPVVVNVLTHCCDRIEPLGTVAVTHFGTRGRLLNLYLGHNLRAVWPWLYGPYRWSTITPPNALLRW